MISLNYVLYYFYIVTCFIMSSMDINETHLKPVLMVNAGIVERDGLLGLYRGFVPNALKNLPNSRYPFYTPW